MSMGCYQSMIMMQRYCHIRKLSMTVHFKAENSSLLDWAMRLTFGKGSASISNHLILSTLFLVQDSS